MNEDYEKLNLIIQKNYQSISSYLSNIYDILSINIDNRDMKYNIEDDFRYFIFYQSSKVIKFCYTKPTINYSIYINKRAFPSFRFHVSDFCRDAYGLSSICCKGSVKL